MKRILLFLLLGAAACGQESGISPGNSSTFVRYFNGGFNDVAVSVIETSPDHGLLILATSTIQLSELTAPRYKIKLIKTDATGNMEWQKFYPPYDSTGSYKAGGMFVMGDSLIAIAGTNVLSDGSSKLMLLKTDGKGENTKKMIIPTAANTVGAAVTASVEPLVPNGKPQLQFRVLGAILDPSDLNNMVLARVDVNLKNLLWSNAFGSGGVSGSQAGQVTLANKIYLDQATSNLFLGGTVNRNSISAIRILGVQVVSQNEGTVIFDPPIGNSSYNVTGADFCRFGETWAFVGSTNEKFNGNTGADYDILYTRVNADNGAVFSTETFPIAGIGDKKDGAGQNETGNSICATRDGGLLLLGTVNSQGAFGRGGTDYYLIKINAFGTVEWTEQYGSKFDDSGVQVIQASDGGNIVLGTTNLANLKTIMLMKTTENGKIQ